MKKGIYKIRNILNEKVYLGSSCDISARFMQHKFLLNRGKHQSPHLQNAWLMYGEKSFDFSVIEETENLIEREQYWIDVYKKTTSVYNLAQVAGSRKGVPHTQKTKDFLRKNTIEKLTGRKMPQDVKDKISITKKNDPMTAIHAKKGGLKNKGRKVSEEIKKIISSSLMGHSVSEETRAKISASKKGRKHTEEHKRKIRESVHKFYGIRS